MANEPPHEPFPVEPEDAYSNGATFYGSSFLTEGNTSDLLEKVGIEELGEEAEVKPEGNEEL